LESTRPNTDVTEFVGQLLRNVAGGMPVVKASTLTKNYKESTFSSEKSADNDQSFEVSQIQEWFITTFCQPIWAEFIDTAIMAQCFAGVEIPTPEELTPANRQLLFDSDWRGPGQKSLNPVVDEQATAMAVASGMKSYQSACAERGEDWRKNVRDDVAFIKFARAEGLDEMYIQQRLGAKPPVAGMTQQDITSNNPNEKLDKM
jgi:capsid protein